VSPSPPDSGGGAATMPVKAAAAPTATVLDLWLRWLVCVYGALSAVADARGATPMSLAMWGLSWAHGSGGLTDGLLEAFILACSTYHRRP
jgi:hypothetical protein